MRKQYITREGKLAYLDDGEIMPMAAHSGLVISHGQC